MKHKFDKWLCIDLSLAWVCVQILVALN